MRAQHRNGLVRAGAFVRAMQRAVPRNPPPSPGESTQLGHVDAAVTCLWVLTPLAATVSIVIVVVAILTNQWLHTDEKMNNPAYNGTGEKDYLSKLTVSGLWTLCNTNRKCLPAYIFISHRAVARVWRVMTSGGDCPRHS